MKVEAHAPKSEPPARRRHGRLLLLGLALLFVLPISLAWLLNADPYFLRSRSTVNHGTLIAGEVRLGAEGLRSLDGQPLPEPLLEGVWTLAYLGSDACGEACRRALVVMRQVRLAQGREMDRVSRLLVLVSAPPVRDRLALLAEHAGLRVAQAPPGWVRDVARRAGASSGAQRPIRGERIWLVDPGGRLVLYFGLEDDPRGLIGDLERLLKLSRIG